jgi:hypothetical protein
MASKKGAEKRRAERRNASPEELRRQLEQDVQTFLNGGGKIHRIQEGVSGEKDWHPSQGEIRPCTRVHIQLPVSYGSL